MSKLNRRQTLSFGLGAAGIAATGAHPAEAAGPPATFTLLLVNDIYRMGEKEGRGGFARLATIVRAERARGVPVLYCHAGDCFSPSLMSGFDQGAHIVELLNVAPPDIFVPGNHEFDFGPAVYRQRMGEARFPFFAANLREADGSVVAGMRDRAIVRLGPVAVGVVGLALADTPAKSQTGDLRFAPEMPVLEREVAALRREGAAFIVAVAHTERGTDEAIVRSRLVDVLLSGHDHDLAIGYDGRTVMVESSEEGHFVTAIDIAATPGPDGKLTWVPSFRVHDSATVEPDEEASAIVRRLEAELSRELDVVIGTAAVALDSRTEPVRSRETSFGNLIADAVRAATEADVAILNGGSLRGNVVRPPGSRLTRRDILAEMPFGNTTALVEVTGAALLAALENGLSGLRRPAGRFPQVSGLALVVDPSRPVGARILEARVGADPLDPDRRYRVGTNSFMLAGGDGYGMLGADKVLLGATDGQLVANEVMAEVVRRGTITTGVEGRIVIR